MRIMTTETKVYKFQELTAKQKEDAKQKWAEHDDFPQGQEALESLKKLAAHFSARLIDYEVDYTASSYSSAKFSTDETYYEDENGNEIDREKWLTARVNALGDYNKRTLRGNGDCVLTGVCYDEDAIDGLRIAFIKDKERGLNTLLQAGFKTWLKSIQEEYAYQYTDEAFAEMCDSNDYEFTDKGELV